jgi:pseudouridine-5'-phosphate glycosidase
LLISDQQKFRNQVFTTCILTFKKHVNRMKQYIEIAPQVQEALDSGQAVVALESTIIAHGMPYPQNIETAKRVSQIVRENGAVSATIAIINGKIKVGLDEADLDTLGRGKDVATVSRRDLPYIISQGKNGATTVASTMIIAALAGIRVFVTGGIGGVHRGGESSLDISADLMELAQTNVAVVCAGVKSILDIGKTLEYLETHGVPVIGYQSDEFPAFYTRKSGFKPDFRIDSPEEVAKLTKAKWDLNMQGGLVIGNPIPKKFAINEKVIGNAISDALAEADSKNINGKEVTPFLLGKIKEITKGESLESNIELVCHNAKVGSEIAVALEKLYHADLLSDSSPSVGKAKGGN